MATCCDPLLSDLLLPVMRSKVTVEGRVSMCTEVRLLVANVVGSKVTSGGRQSFVCALDSISLPSVASFCNNVCL